MAGADERYCLGVMLPPGRTCWWTKYFILSRNFLPAFINLELLCISFYNLQCQCFANKTFHYVCIMYAIR